MKLYHDLVCYGLEFYATKKKKKPTSSRPEDTRRALQNKDDEWEWGKKKKKAHDNILFNLQSGENKSMA